MGLLTLLESWITHAEQIFQRLEQRKLYHLQATLQGHDFYHSLADVGYTLGASFLLGSCDRGTGNSETRAFYAPSVGTINVPTLYEIHPGLFDSCFQLTWLVSTDAVQGIQ